MGESSLASRGARGGVVTVAGQAAKLTIQLAGVIVLSRLLGPEDFGLVAMVAVVMKLGELLRDFGMPTAALQARTLSHQQASNMFWINAALGTGATILAITATPLLIAVYHEPRLDILVPAMAISLAINGLQAQVQVQLARAMRFATLAITDVTAQAVGLGLAITTALAGWAYWALVVQQVATVLTLLVLRSVSAHWLPSRPRRGHDTIVFLRAGGSFGAAQLLGFAASNADTVAIGARWGAVPLGEYNRAFQLLSLPIAGILGPLSNVVIPTINRAKDDGHHVWPMLIRLQFAVGFVVVGVFSVSAAVAPALIPLALGDGWESTVSLFQILAVGGAFQAFSYVSYWVFILEHQQRQLLMYNIVTKSFATVLVIFGAFFGIEAVAWAYSAGLIISWPVNLIWLWRCAGQPSSRFLRNGLQIIAAGAVGFGAGWGALTLLPPASNWAELAVGGIAACVGFVVPLILSPHGRRSFSASISLLMSGRQTKNNK